MGNLVETLGHGLRGVFSVLEFVIALLEAPVKYLVHLHRKGRSKARRQILRRTFFKRVSLLA